jgi:hypothetical protein
MGRLARIRAATTLEELYAEIPQPVGCTGQCWESCGPIGFSVEEGRRMEAAGVKVPNANEARLDLYCPALGKDRCCMVYEVRPVLCRVWGVSEPMPCPVDGCFAPFPLDAIETQELLRKSLEIGGDQLKSFYDSTLGGVRDVIRKGLKDMGRD